jgi:hypothetical protein
MDSYARTGSRCLRVDDGRFFVLRFTPSLSAVSLELSPAMLQPSEAIAYHWVHPMHGLKPGTR